MIRELAAASLVALVAGLALPTAPAAAQSCAAPDFATPAAFAVGDGPRASALADFDRDGRLDLVTANLGADDLTVRWGDGAGGFEATYVTVALGAGTDPVALVTGDFNRDGAPDVVLALRATQRILPVFRGFTARAFTLGTTLAVDNAPLAIAAGDFDRDGDLDVVTTGDIGAVQISRNNGSGAFSNGSRPSPGGTLADVVVADFNEDARLDLAIARQVAPVGSPDVVLLLDDTLGGWVTREFPVAAGEPVAVAAADLDRDGHVDVVAGVENADTVSVLPGDGDGGLGAPLSSDLTGPQAAIALADFDRDGTLDMAAAHPGMRVVTLALGDGSGRLAGPVDFALLHEPVRLAVADLDADGRADLVASAEAGDLADVLTNRSGIGCPYASFPLVGRLRGTGTAVYDVAAGDLNSDGVPDLATADSAAATVSVLLGAGNGWVAPATVLDAGAGADPRAVAFADIDGDLTLDVLVASRGASRVSLFRGSGGGAFGARADWAVTVPVALAVGDLNHDGRPDVVVAKDTAAPNLAILLNNGAGGFGISQVSNGAGDSPASVALADFDGDGDLDIVTANDFAQNASVLLGNGTGGFGAPSLQPLGVSPASVTVGDWNGDGRPDFATANGTGNSLSVRLGNGLGGFVAAPTLTASFPYFVRSADVNLDGRSDLVAACASPENSVAVFLGAGGGTFGAPIETSGFDSPRTLAVADFDRDSVPDLAVPRGSATAPGHVSIVPGRGDGRFGPEVAAGAIANGVALEDVDHDGITDLTTFHRTSGVVATWLGDGAGRFTPMGYQLLSSTSLEGMVVADFDRDGNLDLVVGSDGSSTMFRLLGDGLGNLAPPAGVPVATGGRARAAAVGDFNRDGKPDIVTTNAVANTISVLIGDGLGAFSDGALTSYATGQVPVGVAVGDWDGDGDDDVAVTNFAGNTASIRYGTGTGGTLPTGTTFAVASGPYGIVKGDFDRDGDLDLAMAVVGGVQVLVNTAGAFTPAAVVVVPGAPKLLAAADFNRDGRLDLATPNHTAGNSVSVLLGDGAGSFALAESFWVPATVPGLAVAADLNRDARPDLVVTQAAAPTILLNTTCQATRLRLARDVSTCNSPGVPFAAQPLARVEDDGGNLIACDAGPVTASIVAGVGGASLLGQNPLPAAGGVADWSGAVPPLAVDLAGKRYRLELTHPTAGPVRTRSFSAGVAIAITGPAAYCAASARTFSADPDFDTYRWFLDGSGPVGFLSSLTIPGGSLAASGHDVRVDGTVDTCPATASLPFTVYADLASVSVAPAGPYTITSAATGPSLTVSETGGGTVTRKWGYRSVSGGPISFFAGETGPTYTIEGADFPGQGTYYVVAEALPLCGLATASNEVEVRVVQATTTNGAPALTVTSTDNRNLLEWTYPAGYNRVRISYNSAASWSACVPPANEGDGSTLSEQTDSGTGRGSFPHTGLTNGQVYCYAMFTEVPPGSGVYPTSTRRTVKARPFATSGRVKWAFSTGAAALAPPGLGPGILHVVSDSTLYAIDKGTGTWPSGFKPFGASGPSQSRPATVPIAVGPASHVVFLGSQNAVGHNALAVDADTGLGLWGQALGAPVEAGPGAIFTAYGGAYDYVLLGNRNSSGGSAFFALDPATGATAGGGWPYVGEAGNEIGIVSSQAAVDYPGSRAFFTSFQRLPGVSDSVWCVDLDTAARCSGWAAGTTAPLGHITASPTLRGGRLYVAAVNGTNAEVQALDATDGTTRWGSRFAPADGPVKLFVLPDPFTNDLYFSTTGNVWSLRDDGASWFQRWVRPIAGASQPVFFPFDQLVWVGGGDGRLYTLRPGDGTDAVAPLTLGEGTSPAGAPTVDSAGGFVYVGTTAGVVYAVAIQ
jgi:hypothetical protein